MAALFFQWKIVLVYSWFPVEDLFTWLPEPNVAKTTRTSNGIGCFLLKTHRRGLHAWIHRRLRIIRCNTQLTEKLTTAPMAARTTVFSASCELVKARGVSLSFYKIGSCRLSKNTITWTSSATTRYKNEMVRWTIARRTPASSWIALNAKGNLRKTPKPDGCPFGTVWLLYYPHRSLTCSNNASKLSFACWEKWSW